MEINIMPFYDNDDERQFQETLKRVIAKAAGIPDTATGLPRTLDDWKAAKQQQETPKTTSTSERTVDLS